MYIVTKGTYDYPDEEDWPVFSLNNLTKEQLASRVEVQVGRPKEFDIDQIFDAMMHFHKLDMDPKWDWVKLMVDNDR